MWEGGKCGRCVRTYRGAYDDDVLSGHVSTSRRTTRCPKTCLVRDRRKDNGRRQQEWRQAGDLKKLRYLWRWPKQEKRTAHSLQVFSGRQRMRSRSGRRRWQRPKPEPALPRCTWRERRRGSRRTPAAPPRSSTGPVMDTGPGRWSGPSPGQDCAAQVSRRRPLTPPARARPPQRISRAERRWHRGCLPWQSMALRPNHAPPSATGAKPANPSRTSWGQD